MSAGIKIIAAGSPSPPYPDPNRILKHLNGEQLPSRPVSPLKRHCSGRVRLINQHPGLDFNRAGSRRREKDQQGTSVGPK